MSEILFRALLHERDVLNTKLLAINNLIDRYSNDESIQFSKKIESKLGLSSNDKLLKKKGIIPNDLLVIIQYVDNFFGVDIRTRSRVKHIAQARQIYFKIARDKTQHTLGAIAWAVACNHATAIHGINKFDYLFEQDNFFKEKVNSFQEYLKDKNLK